ncbi:hypothetical protein [Nonlabens xiamenensis]|uniref:hypothetical protein n=1 Tax=Nonlabens xiamenensis TaxID=2341043 RepID=UPI000F6156C3|nr:hypothetical protein [Nonlabens xiamenensis]
MNIDTLVPSKAQLLNMYNNYPKRTLMRIIHDVQTKYGERPERKRLHCLTIPEFRELREELGEPLFDTLGRRLAS